jgi:hypothetical protein
LPGITFRANHVDVVNAEVRGGELDHYLDAMPVEVFQ